MGSNDKPIRIDPDVAAMSDRPGVAAEFDAAFRKVIRLPADAVPKNRDVPKNPRGRPKKT